MCSWEYEPLLWMIDFMGLLAYELVEHMEALGLWCWGSGFFFLKANLWTMSIPNGTKHWSLWDKEGLCSQLSPRWLIGLFKEQCYIRCSPVDSATIRPVKFIFLRGKEPGLRAHVLPLSLLTTPLSFLCMDAQCCSCSGWFKMWFLKTLTWSIYAI